MTNTQYSVFSFGVQQLKSWSRGVTLEKERKRAGEGERGPKDGWYRANRREGIVAAPWEEEGHLLDPCSPLYGQSGTTTSSPHHQGLRPVAGQHPILYSHPLKLLNTTSSLSSR